MEYGNIENCAMTCQGCCSN